MARSRAQPVELDSRGNPREPARGEAVAAAATLAALGASDPAAAAFDGHPAARGAAGAGAAVLSAAEVAGATARVVGALMDFGTRRAASDADWLALLLGRRYPERTEAERGALVGAEMRREAEFRRKQRARLERDLPRALRTTDPAEREAEVRKILERERRYLVARRDAMTERAVAAAELRSVREASPKGGYWKLSPYVREHTLDCLAMGEKFWPWEVLDEVHPPLHNGCACAIYTLEEAVERDLMDADQVPDTRDAVARATKLLADARAAMEECTAAEVEEVRLARELDLAEGEALEERARNAEYEAETERIRASAKTARARGVHKFEAAEWTHPNGHPRCRVCGQEESISPECNREPTAAEVRAFNEELAAEFGDQVDVEGRIRLREVSWGVPGRGGRYYGARAAERFAAGFQQGGQFRGPRTGVRTRALAKGGRRMARLAALVDMKTPKQKRRDADGVDRWLGGQLVRVPEHREFRRTIGGTTFTSPPGSTRVYADGKEHAPDAREPAHRRGKPSPVLSGATVLPHELAPGDHFADLTGQVYRVDEAKPGRRGRTKLALTSPRTGYPLGTHAFGGDQGFRRVPAPTVQSPRQQQVEAAAEAARAERALPAVSQAASALERLRAGLPPVIEGVDAAAADSALRDLGFREVGLRPGLGHSRISYVHPETSSTLAVSYRSRDGRAFDVEWDPRGAPRQPAVQAALSRAPRGWEDFTQAVSALVDTLAEENGAPAHLRAIDVDPGIGDHGAMHEWSGDLLLGRQVRPDVERAAAKARRGEALHDGDHRALWASYKAAAHEAVHAVNPIDQELYERPHHRALEEALAEEVGAQAAAEMLRRHGFEGAVAWAAANPGDDVARGTYLGDRAKLDALLDDARVAPERRSELHRELALRVPPAERDRALAQLLVDGDPGRFGSEEQAAEHARRALAGKAPDTSAWAPPVPVDPGEGALPPPGPNVGGTPVREGDRVVARRRVRRGTLPGGVARFETEAQRGEVLAVHPLGAGGWVATVRYADGAVRNGVLPREITPAGRADPPSLRAPYPAQGGGQLHPGPGDRVAWPRPAGGESEGEVISARPAEVAVRAGARSPQPGAAAALTPARAPGLRPLPQTQVTARPPAERPPGARTGPRAGRGGPGAGVGPTPAQAAAVARELGLALPKAQPGRGEEYAGLLARELERRRESRRRMPALAGYDEGWEEGMRRAREVAAGGGSFDDVADAMREYRAGALPRGAELGEHPREEGVVTGMIYAAVAGREAERGEALAAFATRGRAQLPIFGHGRKKPKAPGWQAKVYGGAKEPEEPPVDAPRLDDGAIVRDPAGDTWRVTLTGTEDAPTLTLTARSGKAEVFEEAAFPGGWTFVRGPFGDRRPAYGGGKTYTAGGGKTYTPPKPKAPGKDDSGKLTHEKAAGGSTGAQWYRDGNGDRWLVKRYGGDLDRVATELLANGVYREMGANVPAAGQVLFDGRAALAYRAVEAEERKGWTGERGPSAELSRHFMTDALVANWDFVGLEDDNVLWQPSPAGEVPLRVDQGGSLQYRAQGGRKDFGAVPAEAWTMLGPKGQGFRSVHVTEAEQRRQAAEIGERLTDERLDALAGAAPFADEGMRAEVRDALKARVGWMRRFAAGEEDVPRPLEGDEARAELAAAQEGMALRPEEQDALLQLGAGGLGPVNRELRRRALEFPRDEARLAAIGGAPFEQAEAPGYGGDVDVSAGAGPTRELALEAFRQRREPAFLSELKGLKPGKERKLEGGVLVRRAEDGTFGVEGVLRPGGGGRYEATVREGLALEEAARWLAESPPVSAGVIVREPDGRVWMVRPRGGFGGYKITLPKGRVDAGQTEQEAALRELWEESGLTARITGVVGDYAGDVTVTRFFLAERTGGAPATSAETSGVALAGAHEAGLRERDLAALRDAGAGPLDAGQEAQVRALDGLLGAASTSEDFVGWVVLPGELDAGRFAGKALEDRGYLGVALTRAEALRLGGKGTMVRLTVPAGSKAVHARGFAALAGEELHPEVLVRRGARFVVRGPGEGGDVEAVLLP